MREFASISEFNAFLDTRAAAIERGFLGVFTRIGVIMRTEARDRLGYYHAREGPFPGWKQLSPATQADRERQRYTPNEPLLRDGTLQRSISSTPTPFAVAVGVRRGETNSQGVPLGMIAMWQEFGAARLGEPWIPPRPFLGPSLYATIGETVPLLAESVVARLLGQVEVLEIPISRVPARLMSQEVFLFGKSLTGGVS